ncbi:MAG: hypothetical protein DRJ61_18545 [Acidobacteria bacterium]|nr:MAG: hypothetical protein DRJ61_18545 [Acidobacteriota bacterium]
MGSSDGSRTFILAPRRFFANGVGFGNGLSRLPVTVLAGAFDYPVTLRLTVEWVRQAPAGREVQMDLAAAV